MAGFQEECVENDVEIGINVMKILLSLKTHHFVLIRGTMSSQLIFGVLAEVSKIQGTGTLLTIMHGFGIWRVLHDHRFIFTILHSLTVVVRRGVGRS